MKQFLTMLALCAGITGFAQKPGNPVQLVNPAAVATPKGYSQAAVVDLGTANMVLLSGQVAFDKQGNLVGRGNLGQQTEQVFLNMQNILKELGGDMRHVVKIGCYLTDITQLPAFRQARDRFIDTVHPPASTLVQVSKLFRDDVLVEVEATAIIPKQTNGSR
jgi:enamine deaminase RidA (YjgF/YER057c/UK114 family)